MENTVKAIVAKNLTELRKGRGLTQGELAKQLNYSDKTVSKWENGESLPDISVLYGIANFYGITLDELVKENAAERVGGKGAEKRLSAKHNKIIILCLSVAVIFLIASLLFVYLLIWSNRSYPQVFVWAVPASCLALLYGNRKRDKVEALGGKHYKTAVLSVLCWSVLVGVYFQFLRYRLWLIFLIGIPIEAIIILGSKLNK